VERGRGGGGNVGGWREALKIWAYILLFLVLAEGRGCVGRPRVEVGCVEGGLHVDVVKPRTLNLHLASKFYNKNLVITFL
jgi:hypothetical protein